MKIGNITSLWSFSQYGSQILLSYMINTKKLSIFKTTENLQKVPPFIQMNMFYVSLSASDCSKRLVKNCVVKMEKFINPPRFNTSGAFEYFLF